MSPRISARRRFQVARRAILAFAIAAFSSLPVFSQTLQLQGGTGVPGSGYVNTIRNGSGVPSNLLGNNGDFYLETNVSPTMLFGPKTASGWGAGVALAGVGGSSWGSITGTLANQTDLAAALAAKQATLTIGNFTESTSNILTITGGSGAIIGSGLTVQVKQASTSQSGYLSSTDWNTFNGKQASGNYITALTGDATASGPGSAALTLATSGVSAGSCTNCNLTLDAKGRATAQNSGTTANTALAASYTATTANTFVDCNGTVTLPATPVADQTITVYNLGSSTCSVSGNGNYVSNDSGTGTNAVLPVTASIRLHWDSANTHWRFDEPFTMSLGALFSPSAALFLTSSYGVNFGTNSGGSYNFYGAGSPISGQLHFTFKNGGGDDGTNNQVVQWLNSSGSVLAYVDGSGNASFASLTGSLAATNLTGTINAARLPTSVPTSVVNDTNVTGSIASNALTLGWTGTLAKTRLLSTTVFTDQANAYTAGNKQTFAASSTTAGTRHAGVSADPSSLVTGDEWFNTTTNHMKQYDGTTAQTFMYQTDSVTASQMPGLTGDVTTSAGAVATTVAKIQGVTVSGVTGTVNAVLSTSPTLSGTVNASGATAVDLPSSAGAAPTTGGDIRYDSTQNRTVAGGGGAVTGSFPRLIYWAHPTSDVLCAHAGDTSETLSYGATACNNTVTDDTAFTSLSTQPSIPANFMVQDKMLRVHADFGEWSSATASNIGLKVLWGATQIYSNGNTITLTGALANRGFSMECFITANGALGASATMTISCEPQLVGATTPMSSNGTVPVAVVTNATEALKFQLSWTAGGIASGTYTSGITATGTAGQTCNLATFNNGNTAGTATVALTGTNTIAGSTALVITNTGYGSTSAATSATASNGTATCSGTATVATVVGGAQGNAIQLRGVTIEELN